MLVSWKTIEKETLNSFYKICEEKNSEFYINLSKVNIIFKFKDKMVFNEYYLFK